MPRFFFDYRHGGKAERDDEGIEFPSLDAAYSDALKAAVDIHGEARNGPNAADHSFEIRDECGRVLLILPFIEALSVEGRKP